MKHKFHFIVWIFYDVFVFHLIHTQIGGEEKWENDLNEMKWIPYTTSFHSFLKNSNNRISLYTTIYNSLMIKWFQPPPDRSCIAVAGIKLWSSLLALITTETTNDWFFKICTGVFVKTLYGRSKILVLFFIF
jgi:hypothetical protein